MALSNVQRLTSLLEEVTESLETSERTVQSLRSETKQLRNDLEASRKIVGGLQLKLQDAGRDLEARTCTIKFLKQRLDTAGEMVRNFSQRLKDVSEDRDSVERRCTAAHQAVSEAVQQIQDLKEEWDELQGAAEALTKDRDGLLEKLNGEELNREEADWLKSEYNWLRKNYQPYIDENRRWRERMKYAEVWWRNPLAQGRLVPRESGRILGMALKWQRVLVVPEDDMADKPHGPMDHMREFKVYGNSE